MNDDIKPRLDAELPGHAVPFSMDADTAVSLGRQRRRRRRVVTGGASALSIVAIGAVLATSLLSVGGEPDNGAAAGDEVEPPPELDAGTDYVWDREREGKQTEDTQEYTRAYLEHFEAKFPEATLAGGGDHGEMVWFGRETPRLYQGVREDDGELSYSEEVVYERLVFDLSESIDKNELFEAAAYDFGNGHADKINVTIYQPGSFERGAGAETDLEGCVNDSTGIEATDCQVSATSTSSGEEASHVEMRYDSESAPDLLFGHYVVLYRSDGSAVTVSDETSRSTEDDPEPYLSVDDLTGIAEAMPTDPVE